MYSLIIPFHSDYDRLEITRQTLRPRLGELGIEEVLLCHNGKYSDSSISIRLVNSLGPNEKLLHTDCPGIGAGYRIGIRSASQPWIILSASDLPFGFSDLNEFISLIKQTNPTLPFRGIAIGSKLHKDSVIRDYGIARTTLSWGFYILRLILLGKSTPRDSQGTVLIPSDVARSLEARVNSDDFFFTPMLIALAQRDKVNVVEVPVTLVSGLKESSVNSLRDSMKMFVKLVQCAIMLSCSKWNHSKK